MFVLLFCLLFLVYVIPIGPSDSPHSRNQPGRSPLEQGMGMGPSAQFGKTKLLQNALQKRRKSDNRTNTHSEMRER
jgi:hypothetical protein